MVKKWGTELMDDIEHQRSPFDHKEIMKLYDVYLKATQ